jgi:flagellar hook protein FlgE
MAVGSFSAGLSGLSANAQALSVIGNNLANINTLGFKASTVAFQDLVSQSLGGLSINPSQGGLGVSIGAVSPVFSQGAIETSRMATHVAIQGNGFFILEGPAGRSYTRAGNFSFDDSGTLVSTDGHEVQAYTTTDPVTGAIITSGSTAAISVPPGVLRNPVPSSQFQTISNLNADANVGDNFAVAIQINDALGAAHLLTLEYTNTAPGAWNYALTVEGGEITGGTVGTPFTLATGSVGFDSFGVLSSVNGALPADISITTPTWTNGAAANTLEWDIMANGNTTPTITGFSAPSATSSIAQNGQPAGLITNVVINPDGQIVALSGAGRSVVLGQLALAVFNNPQGLVKLGSNQYGEGQSAGLPNVGIAGNGGRGTLVGSALEQSNVDMAQEFTQMILAQRGYQANARTITVSDQLLMETLNLKQ